MDEIKIERGTPVQITPAGSADIIQNTMPTDDDILYVSKTGNVDNAWLELRSGDSMKFEDSLYFTQNSWNSFVFPVIELD